MLENLFSVVLGKLKHKSSSSKSSQHDSTGSSSVVTTTTSNSTTSGLGGRSSDGSSSLISRPYSLPTPPPPLRGHQPQQYATGGQLSSVAGTDAGGSRKENELVSAGNIYMLPDLGSAGDRGTPLSTSILGRHNHHNTTMDDMINYGGTMAPRTVASAANLDPFKRSTKTRMSLPVMSNGGRAATRTLLSQQTNRPMGHGHNTMTAKRAAVRHSHQQQHSMGHIYLQHRGETKQAHLPNELTAIDTIWALFVCAFPQWLTMEYMSLAHVKIYIYNPSCNIFYELQDIDEVKHESILRIHQSDPILALGPPLAQLQYQQQQQQQHMQRLATQQQHMHAPPKPRRMIPSTPTLESQSIYGIATPTLHTGSSKNVLNHHQISNSNLARYQPHVGPYQQQPMSQTFHLPAQQQQQMNPAAANHQQWSSSPPFVHGANVGQHQQHQIQLPPHWQAAANMSPNSQACLRLPDGI